MFSGWVQNHNSNKNWFTVPDSKYVVSKSLVQSIGRIINQSVHQTATSETVAAATQVAYGQIVGVTEWEKKEIPEPMLRLKDGVSAIYLSVGETANLYDYVETNFPIYCVIEGGTGIVDYANADHSKIYSVGSEGNTTTVTIKQYTIDGVTLDVTAGTMRETNFKLQSGGNDVSGGTIELQVNEQKTIEGWWENCPDDKAILDVSITNNGSGTTFTKSGKNIIVTAGSTYGTTETLTVEFSAAGPYFPATKTVNIKVVEAPKQNSDLYAYASSSSVEQDGTVTVNAGGSGGEITYSCPSNVGTMSGNVFTAASNFTGTATITVRQAGTTEREAGEVMVYVNVTKKTDSSTENEGGKKDVEWNIDTSDITRELNIYSAFGLSMNVTDAWKYQQAGIAPIFESSNTSVATVTGEIYNCYIQSVGIGETIITITIPASSEYNEAVRTIKVIITGK